MKYLLDTNICIHFLRGQYNLIDKIQQVELINCAISEITLAELAYGAENSLSPDKNYLLVERFVDNLKILPIYNAIKVYAREKSRLRKKGTLISDFDLLIAATAIVNDLVMVTENQFEFERVSGIEIENWVKR